MTSKSDKVVLIVILIAIIVVTAVLANTIFSKLRGNAGAPLSELYPTGAVVAIPTEVVEPGETCPNSCDDQDNCTKDYCNENTSHECAHERIVPCCGNSICEVDESCGSCLDDCRCSHEGLCCSGECRNVECYSDNDCEDNNRCTMDTCKYPGTCNASCFSRPIAPCCGNGICERNLGEDYESCAEDGCPACSSEWGCRDEYTKGYQSSDCSWTLLSYCQYGCKGRDCKPPDCSVGYTYERRCNGDWVQIEYRYWNCKTTWVDWYYCYGGCRGGECKVGGEGGGQICSPNSLRCNENWKEKCKSDGSGWIKVKYCDYKCDPYWKDCIIAPLNDSDTGGKTETLTVTKVIDGDTIDLSNGERVRLIGIDAPEYYESCYSESKEELEHLVLSKPVTLEKDVSERDKYSRLLRYVYAYGTFVNEAMVRNGYATAWAYEPDTKYSGRLENAEDYARVHNAGCFWS